MMTMPYQIENANKDIEIMKEKSNENSGFEKYNA